MTSLPSATATANMQTVPSLVGTSAAVAAAAVGLVFGQAIEPDPSSLSSIRPFSSKTRASLCDTRTGAPRPLSHSEVNWPSPRSPLALFTHDAQPPPPLVEEQQRQHHSRRMPISISSRTNANGSRHHSRALDTQVDTPPPNNARRHTLRNADYSAPITAEDARDSVSSAGSWIRRLSRPLSQHGSPRSSVCPESPSLSFSNTSGPPILSPTSSVLPSLPPNKLVKRTPSTQVSRPGTVSQSRQRTHLSLRRPATSHQRSETLQQFQQNVIADAAAAAAASPKFSLGRRLPNLSSSLYTPTHREPAGWSSFLHSHVVKVTNRTPRSTESGPAGRIALTTKRIRASANRKVAHLMRASMLSSPPPPQTEEQQMVPEHETPQRDSTHSRQTSAETPDEALSQAPARSMPMHFSSPASWIQKNGSIRRLKRSLESKPDPKRHVSAPTTCESPDGHRSGVYTPSFQDGKDGEGDLDSVVMMPESTRSRPRNTSSPIPPLSRLSSFNVDMSRLGPPAPILPGQHGPYPRHHQPSGSSQTSSALGRLTINSYDSEARCFTSTDDDETMWDSIRTGTSARMRNTETPLESLFDESPPTSACQAKARRMSIHELLGRPWDVDYTKIMEEEDEGVATPVCGVTTTSVAKAPLANRLRSPRRDRDGGRASLDEDFDDDWARDDDDRLCSPLSPPSKGSSLHARSVSPSIRLALASISGNGGSTAVVQRDLSIISMSSNTQPSELSSPDKPHNNRPPRSRSVSIKYDADRGGRPPLRRGMMGTHTRSHSVPVVQDPPVESQKPNASKFGTWGLGTKIVSEDWDDDFDFDIADGGPGAKLGGKTFEVPASIQATQPSVKAHSGQIKEFSILVNELRKLCRIGRELDLFQGLQPGLWKEAEGIIALASPDDAKDPESERERERPALPAVELEPLTINDRYLDDGFDAAFLRTPENPRSLQDLAMSKTTVLRDRPSPRRRSVFSPDDEIFGGSHWPLVEQGQQRSRPRTPENASPRREHDLAAAMHAAMEAVHHKASWDKVPSQSASDGKIHFGTNSLKALVKRAGELRDALWDIVRSTEPAMTSSPLRTPRRSANNGYIATNGNPAFTRVFNDRPSSPPRRPPQNHSSNSILGRTSLDASPSSIGQCMQMMTVN